MSCQGTLMGRGAHSDAPLISGYGEDDAALLADGATLFDPTKPESALPTARARRTRVERTSGEGPLGMLSEAGGAVMETLVSAAAELTEERDLDRTEVVEAISDGLEQIAAVFPEATDEEVREKVSEELAPAFGARGWKPVDPEELFHLHPWDLFTE